MPRRKNLEGRKDMTSRPGRKGGPRRGEVRTQKGKIKGQRRIL